MCVTFYLVTIFGSICLVVIRYSDQLINSIRFFYELENTSRSEVEAAFRYLEEPETQEGTPISTTGALLLVGE